MNWKAKTWKSKLVRQVAENGFSFRQAEQGVNAVFDCIRRALCRGEVVEVPGGCLRVRQRNGQQRRVSKQLRNIQTGQPMSKVMTYPGRRRSIQFKPDVMLDLTPPPMPNAEELEVRKLASEFLGCEQVDQSITVQLQAAVDRHPNRPGALLRRLRQGKQRGWQVRSVGELADLVAGLYWL